MFHHSGRLPHVLSPDCYRSGEWYAREVKELLRPAWHMVATTDDLANPGDFLTLDLLGEPLHLRNFAGELRALSNICAHRHCLITDRAQGTSEKMSCQYHGWEYGEDGRTRKISQPKNFAPIDREVDRLSQYRLATCGSLVFVSLVAEGPSLSDQLGGLYDRLAERFGDAWRPYLKWSPEYDANWKVPIENTLEAYHVPYVHPETFREDPGSERSTHELNPRHTSFSTDLPFSPHSRLDRTFQRCEGWLMRRLGDTAENRYEQHHVFPNFLCSFTDVVSLCQSILPIGPASCRGVVRQFGRVGTRARFPWRHVAGTWGRIEATISRRILEEDRGMFASIQQGLNASQHPGVLGACEERIWKFQQYVEAIASGQWAVDSGQQAVAGGRCDTVSPHAAHANQCDVATSLPCPAINPPFVKSSS